MSQENGRFRDERIVVTAILGIVAIYLITLGLGWPQNAAPINHGDSHSEASPASPLQSSSPNSSRELAAAKVASPHHDKPSPPAIWAVFPFLFLLAAIAVFPLIPSTAHWWESNGNRLLLAAGLAFLTLAYYALVHPHPIERHFLGHEIIPREVGPFMSWSLPLTVVQNAILGEYVPFIVLLFSLYVITGGIRISGDVPAHPLTNTAFIGVGGLLASFVGTTGAAMLLIRPLLETNSERKRVGHTVVFFIFVVCNCGGCLLPIGDPPLFLGYLEGVPFLWTLSLWKQWAFVNLALLAIYYGWDHFYCYPREDKRDIAADQATIRRLRVRGLWPNLLLLAGVVLAVGILDPSKPIPGTHWHPWLWLREIVQIALVGLSLSLGSAAVRQENRFNYGAIIEVAVLFLGIFVCMQPALQILDVQGGTLGIDTAAKFFWSTGSLSSVLDNAPTYLVFFKTAQALDLVSGPSQAGVPVDMLAAISLGAVFMGAMTYIGNGPNFMVKAIAESSGVKMPSFFGYMVYSFCILLPLFVALQLLFF